MCSSAVATENQSEMELLFCCTRVQLQPAVAERIGTLLARPLDWERLLRLAETNKVLPLLHHHLNGAWPDAVPPAIAARLKERARAIAGRNLVRTGELVRVLRLFAAHNIVAVPIKGPVLCATAYGNLALREYNDLDILIPEAGVVIARDLLIAEGYRPDFLPALSQEAAALEVAREYQLYHKGHDILIELQWRMVEKQFCVPFDPVQVQSRLRPVCIAGTTVMGLGTEDTLLFLCVHGGKHQWSRLGWICDVAEHIRSSPNLDWQCVLQDADSLFARRMLLLGLTLARELLGAAVPGQILQQAQADAAVLGLSEEIMARLRRGDTSERGALAAFWYHSRLRERVGDGLLLPWRMAAGISVRDLALVNLPRPLFPLYLIVRPVRLVLKYVGSIGKRR